METAKITSKGQITVPKKIRELMAVESGDQLAFEVDSEGVVRITPVRAEAIPLKGFLADVAGTGRLDEREIRLAIRQRAARKYGAR
jgi:antitoxin PrlF